MSEVACFVVDEECYMVYMHNYNICMEKSISKILLATFLMKINMIFIFIFIWLYKCVPIRQIKPNMCFMKFVCLDAFYFTIISCWIFIDFFVRL